MDMEALKHLLGDDGIDHVIAAANEYAERLPLDDKTEMIRRLNKALTDAPVLFAVYPGEGGDAEVAVVKGRDRLLAWAKLRTDEPLVYCAIPIRKESIERAIAVANYMEANRSNRNDPLAPV
jgi:hypothetical protein